MVERQGRKNGEKLLGAATPIMCGRLCDPGSELTMEAKCCKAEEGLG